MIGIRSGRLQIKAHGGRYRQGNRSFVSKVKARPNARSRNAAHAQKYAFFIRC
jgi:hypothetical protein